MWRNGQVVGTRPWNDMSLQSLLPSFRDHTNGDGVTVSFDYSAAVHGGSCLKLTMDPRAATPPAQNAQHHAAVVQCRLFRTGWSVPSAGVARRANSSRVATQDGWSATPHVASCDARTTPSGSTSAQPRRATRHVWVRLTLDGGNAALSPWLRVSAAAESALGCIVHAMQHDAQQRDAALLREASSPAAVRHAAWHTTHFCFAVPVPCTITEVGVMHRFSSGHGPVHARIAELGVNLNPPPVSPSRAPVPRRCAFPVRVTRFEEVTAPLKSGGVAGMPSVQLLVEWEDDALPWRDAGEVCWDVYVLGAFIGTAWQPNFVVGAADLRHALSSAPMPQVVDVVVQAVVQSGLLTAVGVGTGKVVMW